MWETVYSLLSHISPSYPATFSRELADQLARYVVYTMALITSSPLVLGYSQTTSESQPKWYMYPHVYDYIHSTESYASSSIYSYDIVYIL